MEDFFENEITEYEIRVLLAIKNRLIVQRNSNPTKNDVMHELIRLAEIALRHCSID